MSLLSVAYFAGVKIARVEIKLDLLWDAFRAGGALNAVKHGAATMNSPVELTDEGRRHLGKLARELRDFYGRIGYRMDDMRLMVEISRRWSKEIQQIALASGMPYDACLVIAVRASKEHEEQQAVNPPEEEA